MIFDAAVHAVASSLAELNVQGRPRVEILGATGAGVAVRVSVTIVTYDTEVTFRVPEQVATFCGLVVKLPGGEVVRSFVVDVQTAAIIANAAAAVNAFAATATYVQAAAPTVEIALARLPTGAPIDVSMMFVVERGGDDVAGEYSVVVPRAIVPGKGTDVDVCRVRQTHDFLPADGPLHIDSFGSTALYAGQSCAATFGDAAAGIALAWNVDAAVGDDAMFTAVVAVDTGEAALVARLGHSSVVAVFPESNGPVPEDRSNNATAVLKELKIVVDVSGSMGGLLDGLRGAVNNLLVQALGDHNAGYLVTVVAFNHEAKVVAEACQLDVAGKDKIMAAVKALRAGGTTNISAGLRLAVGQPTATATRQVITVLFGDGGHNCGAPEPERAVEIPPGDVVHCVALGSTACHATLQQIAEAGGGMCVFATSEADLLCAFADIGSKLEGSLVARAAVDIADPGAAFNTLVGQSHSCARAMHAFADAPPTRLAWVGTVAATNEAWKGTVTLEAGGQHFDVFVCEAEGDAGRALLTAAAATVFEGQRRGPGQLDARALDAQLRALAIRYGIVTPLTTQIAVAPSVLDAAKSDLVAKATKWLAANGSDSAAAQVRATVERAANLGSLPEWFAAMQAVVPVLDSLDAPKSMGPAVRQRGVPRTGGKGCARAKGKGGGGNKGLAVPSVTSRQVDGEDLLSIPPGGGEAFAATLFRLVAQHGQTVNAGGGKAGLSFHAMHRSCAVVLAPPDQQGVLPEEVQAVVLLLLRAAYIQVGAALQRALAVIIEQVEAVSV